MILNLQLVKSSCIVAVECSVKCVGNSNKTSICLLKSRRHGGFLLVWSKDYLICTRVSRLTKAK